MPKHIHEMRDPVHVFVRFDTDERRIIDSDAFQRLRHIHQLALTYLVYPGATHRRFEHSLGVMELAGRVFDVVTHPYSIHDDVRRLVPEITDPKSLGYWRSCLRAAALCHDLGHLPFSHAAEAELLPEGWNHEAISREIILSENLRDVFSKMTPPLRAEDVAKLALGPKKSKDPTFTAWQEILAEIIIGDAFGVDRMDYLLRDSHHAGVAYGRFDHHRLIDTLRILPSPPVREEREPASGYTAKSREPSDAPAGSQMVASETPTDRAKLIEASSGRAVQPYAPRSVSAAASLLQRPAEPALGIEEGGLHSAEALMLARFFMYSQLYFHPVRRAYDIHLMDFLKQWLKNGRFPTPVAEHLAVTDCEVTAAMLLAARIPEDRGHLTAKRVTSRSHFRVLYQRHPDDVHLNPEAGRAIFDAAGAEFGPEQFRHDRYSQRGGAPDFPVLTKDGRIASSLAMSQTLRQLEPVSVDFVFADPAVLDDAGDWLRNNREKIITPTEG